MNANVDKWLDAHKNELVNSLCESVRFPSVEAPAEENAPFGKAVRGCLDHALGLAQDFGFETRDMDGYIGLADYGAGAETLGVMCHLDVVPEGEGWAHPPYAADIVDGKIIGRGTLDDKGAAIASLYALKAIAECNIPLKRRVRIMLGCNEETGWGCMNHYAQHEKWPDIAFSPDAEYPLVNSEKGIFHANFTKYYDSHLCVNAGTVVNAVPGKAVAEVPFELSYILPIVEAFMEESDYACAMEQCDLGTLITVTGVAAHASTPEIGKNAIQAMIELLTKLPFTGEDERTLNGIFNMFKYETDGETAGVKREDESGALTLNLGLLHWDEDGIADLTLDIRYPISLDPDFIAETLCTGFASFGMEKNWHTAKAGHFVSKDSELVSKLLKVYEARSGKYLPPLSIGGGTYARVMDNAVAFGIEQPGVESTVHMANEFITIDELLYDAKMIADAIIALAAE